MRWLAAWLLAVGLPIAAAPLQGREGTVDLEALRGRLVYLDFWASWCAPCKHSFPWMASLHQRYADKGLTIVAVNVDTRRQDAEHFLAQVPAPFTVAFDPRATLPRTYAIKGMPSSVLIGPDGKILATHTGFNDSTPAKVEADIERALKGQP